MTRIGIYGGTFSPPHNGHLAAARAFMEQMWLDILYVIPAAIPPHKQMAEPVSAADRLEMCRRAFAGMEGVYVSDMEIRRGGKSYTVDTLRELSGDDRRLFLLCGTDMVLTLDEWRPKTLHARTAAAQIPVDYPAFADPLIVSAVRWHTTGHAGMTLTEKLLYLADYIDASRTFRSCVLLRRYFWGAEPEKLTPQERKTLLLSYDMTIRDLLEEGTPVAADTVEARNELLREAAGKT